MKTFSIQPGPVRPSVSSGCSAAPARHDERVVRERLAVVEVDLVGLEIDVVDLGPAELDAVAELPPARADDLVDTRASPNGTKRRPGW